MEFFIGVVSCWIVKDKVIGCLWGIVYVDFGEEVVLNVVIMWFGEVFKGRLVDIVKSWFFGDDGFDGRGGRGGGCGSCGGGCGGGCVVLFVVFGCGCGGLGFMFCVIMVMCMDNGEGV